MSSQRSFDELTAAYEGLESAESFADPSAVASYRAAMLERSRSPADLLAPVLPDGARVLEVGCGNGRLLIELARRGTLGSGLGLDIARSRIEFARDWAAADGHAQLEFRAGDVFDQQIPEGAFDAAVCITGAFGYFDAVQVGAARELAELMRRSLKPGGRLVLELYQHPRELRLLEAAGGDLRTWTELREPDPWRFYLSRFTLEDRVLVHQKTFVHRTTGEIDEGRSERLRVYAPAELEALLRAAGLRAVELREGWADEPYAGGEVLVVTAHAD